MNYLMMSDAHVHQVAEIESLCFSTPWSESSIASEVNNPLSVWFVAEEDGNVIGYVGSQTVLGESDMMNLAVLPEYRRQGIGRRLVETLVSHLSADSVTSLTLEVRASNAAAVFIYNSMGFVEVGRRPNYYTKPKEDALILRKDLCV